MECKKEIAEKVAEYRKLKGKADELYEEIKEYFEDELGADGFGEPFIADKPKGDKQNNDEYCDQYQLGDDWYEGTYYHKIENSNNYVGYSYCV